MAEWMCSCGEYNNGMFTTKCVKCGLKKGTKKISIPLPPVPDQQGIMTDLLNVILSKQDLILKRLEELPMSTEPEIEVSEEEITQAIEELKRTKKEELQQKKNLKRGK